MVVSHACTLVNVLGVQEKHHQRKLQVMPTASASEVFALNDGRKNTTSASCRRSRPSWALVGAGCSAGLHNFKAQQLVILAIFQRTDDNASARVACEAAKGVRLQHFKVFSSFTCVYAIYTTCTSIG